MALFHVIKQERHARTVAVEADSAAEALEIAKKDDQDDGVLLEWVQTFDSATWDVEDAEGGVQIRGLSIYDVVRP